MVRAALGVVRYVGLTLEEIARRSEEGVATAAEIREAEQTVLGAVYGEDRGAVELAVSEVVKRPARKAKKVAPTRLAIEVVLGNITTVAAPLIVVGHYRGVAPVNAEGALDRALNSWISRAGELGMIGGGLGELFFIPVSANQIPAKAVLLAGMGEPGKFGWDDLRYLMMNVCYASAALSLNHFATVLIGTGAGGLSKDRAMRSMSRWIQRDAPGELRA